MKYLIELVNDPTDPNEPPYPRERFETEHEAYEAALYRCANHNLAFRVLKVESDGQVTEINRIEPI